MIVFYTPEMEQQIRERAEQQVMEQRTAELLADFKRYLAKAFEWQGHELANGPTIFITDVPDRAGEYRLNVSCTFRPKL